MPTPKLPDPNKFERLLKAIEKHQFASMFLVVMAVCGTLAVCLHK